MAVITTFNNTQVVPSDVFGWEVNTDVGYGRESFEITLPKSTIEDYTIRVGTILEVDYAAKTAKPLEVPADAAAVEALGELAVFVGRDLPTNPEISQDFDSLSLKESGVGVAITRGDGRGVLKKGYLDIAYTQFYKLPEDVQRALQAKFTTENRFKVLDQQYTPKA